MFQLASCSRTVFLDEGVRTDVERKRALCAGRQLQAALGSVSFAFEVSKQVLVVLDHKGTRLSTTNYGVKFANPTAHWNHSESNR